MSNGNGNGSQGCAGLLIALFLILFGFWLGGGCEPIAVKKRPPAAEKAEK